MSLFSTIRGKKGVPGIGTVAVGPIASKTKKLVIQEWPNFPFQKTFGLGDNENPADNEAFMKIWPTVQEFFHKLIVTMQLDDDLVRNACEELGARHVDFIARGFNSNFWDIFLVCMAEVVDETLTGYITDEAKRAEMILAWQSIRGYGRVLLRRVSGTHG
ncbi:unnamed protein product [Haemonchus placei]|uniref:GLOBIN domain-containing protein n=1 Tax=Haemonchus placei TaxID=6290 RepID=A0A0N4X058_HAEPC|nr:unnamed protein product [Haemonchus placei]